MLLDINYSLKETLKIAYSYWTVEFSKNFLGSLGEHRVMEHKAGKYWNTFKTPQQIELGEKKNY